MNKPFASLTLATIPANTVSPSPEQVNVQEVLAALKAQLAFVQAENANLKAKSTQKGSLCKITDKGGLSVYGLGRFPVTLYKSQWIKLIAMIGEIQAFIDANQDKLGEKPAKTQEVEVA